MSYLVNNYVNDLVLSEEFTHEDLVAQALELDVSPDKLKLVLLAQLIDEELSLEDGLDMTIQELITIARDYYQDQITETPDSE